MVEARVKLATVALVATVAASCSVVNPTPPPATQTPSATASESGPAASPTPTPTPEPTCAEQVLAALTPEQRVGQLFMVGLKGDVLTSAMRSGIREQHLGSAYFSARSSAGTAALREVADAVQAMATADNTGGVRFFIGANQEGGLVQALTGPGFDTIPSALDQGQMKVSRLRTRAETWGSQLLDAGVNVDLAPVADVVPPGTELDNPPIGKLAREYGHDPDTVGSHVVAFIEGMREAGVATTVKHFPGLGRVTADTDFTADVIDTVTTRDDTYLGSFAQSVDGGVPFVMVALATYTQIDDTHLAAFSPTVMDGMLRGDLAFDGVIMSDSLTVTAVKSLDPAVRALLFVSAGGDLIVLNSVPQAIAMADALASEAEGNDVLAARIDDAAMHVLAAKEAAGLLDCG